MRTKRISEGACLLCGHSCANVGWQDGSLCMFSRVNEGLLCMGNCGCYWRWIRGERPAHIDGDADG